MARSAFKTDAGYSPNQGNRELYIEYDFSAAVLFNDDLGPEQAGGQIEMVQSVFIDNTDNNVSVTIQLLYGIKQRIVCPALSQGIFPVLVAGDMRYTVACTGGHKVNVSWSNTKREFKVWGPVTVNVAQVTASATPVAGNYANFSGNTGANVSAALFAANAAALRRIVQNPAGNAESIWINFGGVAAVKAPPSFEIVPGDKFDTGTGPIDQTAWTIIALNAIPYLAKEA